MRPPHNASAVLTRFRWFTLIVVCLICTPDPLRAQWWREVSITNGSMSSFSTGVAVGWTAVETHSGGSPTFPFFADSTNQEDSPYSQGIGDLEQFTTPGAFAFVGVNQRVNGLVVGKVYLYLGYQDIYTDAFQQPPGHRYVHKFGISVDGNADPGTADPNHNPGNAMWLPADQQFWNDIAGNSTQIGGFHRCMSAWTAQASDIVLWSGLTIDASATPDPYATKFNIDKNQLFEFDNSVRASLRNGSFESVVDLTPSLPPLSYHKIIIPEYWVPVGGGIGRYETYLTDETGSHSGSGKGVRIFNRQGCLTRGLMQRIQVPGQGRTARFEAWAKPSGADGTRAEIGVDPTGGVDINSSQIVWDTNASSTGQWMYLVASANCGSSGTVTLFLRSTNQGGGTSGYHWSAFDDATVTFIADSTPPTDFSVIDDGNSTSLIHYLHAVIAPLPTDPESGIWSVEYGVGSTPGTTDVYGYRHLATGQTEIEITGLTLQNVHTYYITVRATNNAGLTTIRSTDGITVNAWDYPTSYTWHGPEHLSRSDYNCDTPRIAYVASEGLHAVWRESDGPTWDGTDSRIVHRKRNGISWGQVVQVNAAPRCFLPDVVAHGNGNLSVAYVTPGDAPENAMAISAYTPILGFEETLFSPPHSGRIELAAYGDQVFAGVNQTRTVAFPNRCDVNHGYPQWLPTMALYQGGDIQDLVPLSAGWTGWETILDNAEPCDSDPYDGSPFTMHSGGDISSACPSVFLSDNPAGHLHTIYYREVPQGSNRIEMWYARWANGQWTQESKVGDGVADARIFVAPDGTLHVVYEQDGQIWYTWSAVGSSWTRRVGLGTGRWPEAVAGPDGRVHIVLFKPTGTLNSHGTSLYTPIHTFYEAGRWSLPRAICAPSATIGHPLERPGDFAVDSAGGLHFVWCHNPNDLGWQGEVFRGFFWVDYYTTGPANPYGGGIGEAKLWGGDGPAAELDLPATKLLTLSGKLVTAAGSFKHYVSNPPGWKCVPCFYVQEDDRSSAIRVIAGNAAVCPPSLSGLPSLGQRVSVTGALATVDGERTVGSMDAQGNARDVTWSSQSQVAAGDLPSPIFLSIRTLGGGQLGPTPGVSGGTGLNNVGLLAKVSGRVTSIGVDEAGLPVFYLDDGSAGPIRVRNPGVQIKTSQFVVVTGASAVDLQDSNPSVSGDEIYAPTVMPSSAADVEVVQ